MGKESFHEASVELLREAFEGVKPGSQGTWFVEGSEALLPTLKEVSASQASRKPHPRLGSIGAHTLHLVHMLTWGNACHGGTPPEGDWESTWVRDEFTAEEWDSMRSEVETRYRDYMAWFRDNTDWSHELGVISPLSMLPHVAYHLGAIRQLMPFAE